MISRVPNLGFKAVLGFYVDAAQLQKNECIVKSAMDDFIGKQKNPEVVKGYSIVSNDPISDKYNRMVMQPVISFVYPKNKIIQDLHVSNTFMPSRT
jgi:hypothetical protein